MATCDCSSQCSPISTPSPITQNGPIVQLAGTFALAWMTAVGWIIEFAFSGALLLFLLARHQRAGEHRFGGELVADVGVALHLGEVGAPAQYRYFQPQLVARPHRLAEARLVDAAEDH